MIHSLPLYEYWPNHGHYNYKLEFLIKIADACDYKIIFYDARAKMAIKRIDRKVKYKFLIVAALKKKNGNQFMSRETFDKIAKNYIVLNKGLRK